MIDKLNMLNFIVSGNRFISLLLLLLWFDPKKYLYKCNGNIKCDKIENFGYKLQIHNVIRFVIMVAVWLWWWP